MIVPEPIRASRRLATLTTGAVLLVSSGLSAQEPPLGEPAPPDRACRCEPMHLDHIGRFQAPEAVRSFFRFNRARIGVELGETAVVGGRTGIRLRDVRDAGPAARAGILEGDVLLSLNGTDLGDRPTDRLLDLMAEVEPGDTVTVEYARDGRTATARVVTDRAGTFMFTPGEAPAAWRFPMEDVRDGIAPGARVRLRQIFGGGLELVAMNEGLGGYFDTSEGVLVADAPDGSGLGLRAGDVILSIDGRVVQDPAHARSIIASYRPDETISFEVMREGDRATVTGTRSGPDRYGR